jgi:hypothetical protein
MVFLLMGIPDARSSPRHHLGDGVKLPRRAAVPDLRKLAVRRAPRGRRDDLLCGAEWFDGQGHGARRRPALHPARRYLCEARRFRPGPGAPVNEEAGGEISAGLGWGGRLVPLWAEWISWNR